MEFWRFRFKDFELTVGKMRSAFLALSILFYGGAITLASQSFWLYLFQKVYDDHNSINYWISFFLFLLGTLLLVVYILSKKNAIYSAVFESFRKLHKRILAIPEYHMEVYDRSSLESKRNHLADLYQESKDIVGNSELLISDKIRSQCEELLSRYYWEILYFDGFIDNMETHLIEGFSKNVIYNPQQNLKETQESIGKINKLYSDLRSVIKKKNWLVLD